MVETGENEDVHWDLGKQPVTAESKNGTVILWVNANIYNAANQVHLAEFLEASNRISRFVCLKSVEGASSIIFIREARSI